MAREAQAPLSHFTGRSWQRSAIWSRRTQGAAAAQTNVDVIAGETTQLSQEEIAELKLGRAGGDVVAALQQASSSFAAKTEFAQEKYRRRKTRKHLPHVTARRPTSAVICEARAAPQRGGVLLLQFVSPPARMPPKPLLLPPGDAG